MTELETQFLEYLDIKQALEEINEQDRTIDIAFMFLAEQGALDYLGFKKIQLAIKKYREDVTLLGNKIAIFENELSRGAFA